MARRLSDVEAISRASAERLWETKLESIPSVFARLIYVAHLRSDDSYKEQDFNSLVPACLAAEIIRESHTSCFSAWLSMDLRHKTEDLQPYLESILITDSGNCSFINMPPEAFGELFRKLIPDSASLTEVEMFLSTVSIVKRLVAHRLSPK